MTNQQKIVLEQAANGSNYREFYIPCPYGHYAAKAWGNPNGFPILAIHGWLDNAGTFDRLAPLLSPNYHLVCLEMPGHGLSSHKPSGQLYHFMEGLLDIRRVLEYFHWDKVALLGHSMGCALALMFSALYPDKVKVLIGLDLAKPVICQSRKLTSRNRLGLEEILERESQLRNNLPPVYTYEEAFRRLMKGLNNSVTEEGARMLLKRGTKPAGNGEGVIFSRDLRLRDLWALSTITEETCVAYLQDLRCEFLLVLANDSIFSKDLEEVSPIYEKNCQRFQATFVDGNHFVHLNHPERVAPIINKFLEDSPSLASKI